MTHADRRRNECAPGICNGSNIYVRMYFGLSGCPVFVANKNTPGFRPSANFCNISLTGSEMSISWTAEEVFGAWSLPRQTDFLILITCASTSQHDSWSVGSDPIFTASISPRRNPVLAKVATKTRSRTLIFLFFRASWSASLVMVGRWSFTGTRFMNRWFHSREYNLFPSSSTALATTDRTKLEISFTVFGDGADFPTDEDHGPTWRHFT